MEELIYGGKAFSDFQAFHDASQTFQSGEKEYEFFAIPGRSGDLTINKKRFANRNIPFNCFIREDFVKNFSDLRAYLYSCSGYKKLEYSQDAEYYRMAVFTGGIEPVTGTYNKSGMFTVVFNCKPQRYLKLGDKAFSVASGQTIAMKNPTRFGSYPLIDVTGTGTFVVNNVLFTLLQNTSVVHIDFERQEAWEDGGVNRNRDLTLSEIDFPTIPSGQSTISATGCSLKVYPRWFTI